MLCSPPPNHRELISNFLQNESEKREKNMNLGELIMGKKINDKVMKKNSPQFQSSHSETHLSMTKISSFQNF